VVLNGTGGCSGSSLNDDDMNKCSPFVGAATGECIE